LEVPEVVEVLVVLLGRVSLPVPWAVDEHWAGRWIFAVSGVV